MKVTALIPDSLITDVKSFAKGKTLTESLIKILKDGLYLHKIKMLNKKVQQRPLQFVDGFTAEKVRKLNNRL